MKPAFHHTILALAALGLVAGVGPAGPLPLDLEQVEGRREAQRIQPGRRVTVAVHDAGLLPE